MILLLVLIRILTPTLFTGEPVEAASVCERALRLAPDDPVFRGRFKAMGFINNIKEYGIPAIAANYNGKPVLIKTTGSLYRGGKFIDPRLPAIA